MRPEPDVQIQDEGDPPAHCASRRARLIGVGIRALVTLPAGCLDAAVARILGLCRDAGILVAPPTDAERPNLISAGTCALLLLPVEKLELVGLHPPED